jgi:hypothetical protein
MNEDDLRRSLRQLPAPQAAEPARARARQRALIAFAQTGVAFAQPPERQGRLGVWRYGFALAVLVAIFPFLFVRHHPATENLADDRQLLRQVEKLFPHQVDTVVEENGKVNLSIAQAPMVGSDQPVLVVFKRGCESIRVLSYSGHRICLTLGQEHNCFEVLTTPSGGVILEAENKVWLSTEHPVVAGYSVRAQSLEAPL